MTRIMNQDVVINRLLEKGIIVRARRGWYYLEVMEDEHLGAQPTLYNRSQLLDLFTIEVAPERYTFLEAMIERFTPEVPAGFTRVVERPMRTIHRNRYHSTDRNIYNALERIERDVDGVRRSYGIEYEINRLNAEQESELAYLLDTLPPHQTERDGSLSDSGVEIIFEPVGRETAIDIVKTLGAFVEEHRVNMNNTGMHITFGVDNSEASYRDLVIRTNRLALAVKAAGTQTSIVELFGRDFTSYAELPGRDLRHDPRHRAFNVRNSSCWEARLVSWNCNIDKVMEFFDIAEVLFHRPFEGTDFIKVFELLGSNVDGE